jgi:hypothetical protein
MPILVAQKCMTVGTVDAAVGPDDLMDALAAVAS